MSPQEENALILNQLWNMGEIFDGMLAQITKQVEEAEKRTCTHDWRGIDTGRMCAKCHRIERQA